MRQLAATFVCFITLLFAWGGTAQAQSDTATSSTPRTINVRDYGAQGDEKTDDTSAFQKALDAASSGGLTVFAPRGNYLIAGHLNIPDEVTLEGVWNIPTAFTALKGTTLLATEGEGNADGPPFILLNRNSTLKGITVFYPNQTGGNPPKAYPWTVAGSGVDNHSIIDTLLANPYQAVDFGTRPSGRHYIRNLYGRPLRKGIFVDKCYDVGRIENVHFWPFWSPKDDEAAKALQTYVEQNGESFIFARTDWEYVLNTFSWGYKTGYRFIESKDGPTNGNFLGIGADGTNVALQVDGCAPYGLLITNGEFVSMNGTEPTALDVGTSNTGVVQLSNCAFWGPMDRVAKIRGSGSVMFNNCNFRSWDAHSKGLPAIECSGGQLQVNSSLFSRPGPHIVLEQGADGATIVGNRFAGLASIINHCDADVQIGLNSQAKIPANEPDAIVIDDSATAPSFRAEGPWNLSSDGREYLGMQHWVARGDGSAKAFWQPSIPRKGTYKVFVWYGKDPNKDRASGAPYIVKHAGGMTTATVNLREHYGEWRPLGQFVFDKGNAGYVMATNEANGFVVADAIKFVPVGATQTRKDKRNN